MTDHGITGGLKVAGRLPRLSGRKVAFPVIAYLIAAGLWLLRAQGGVRLLLLSLYFGVGLSVVGAYAWYARRARLCLAADGALSYRGFWGSRVLDVHPGEGKVVKAEVKWGANGPVGKQWLLLDARGQCQLRLSLRVFDETELDALAGHLDLPRCVVPGVMSEEEFKSKFSFER